MGKIRVTLGNEQGTFMLRNELLVDRDEAMRRVRKMRLAWIASLQSESPVRSAEPLRSANVTPDQETMASPLPPIFSESAFRAAEDQTPFDEWMEIVEQ
jgi:hypothetical protein